MHLVNILKRMARTALPSETTEMRSIIMLQRKVHRFSEEELQAAGERAWGKKFDGQDDPMYFVSAHDPLPVVKAGPHIIQVTSIPRRYSGDDQYVLSQLPQPEQKKAWNEHHACTILDLFNDLSSKAKRIPDRDAYAVLAKLALQLDDPNCTAIVVPVKNIMLPNDDGAAEQGLRFLINRELP